MIPCGTIHQEWNHPFEIGGQWNIVDMLYASGLSVEDRNLLIRYRFGVQHSIIADAPETMDDEIITLQSRKWVPIFLRSQNARFLMKLPDLALKWCFAVHSVSADPVPPANNTFRSMALQDEQHLPHGLSEHEAN